MLRLQLCQLSFLHVDPESLGLAPDSFERWLPALLPRLLPLDELRQLFPAGDEGAPTCCPLQLTAMLLLQFRYDLSERELEQRCRRDLGFRYALGLEPGAAPPSPRSLRRFRARLAEVKGDAYLLDLSLRLAREEGLVEDVALQAVDSTNTNCRGAVIDTFNLVAAGIRQVLRVTARCLGRSPEGLAREWELSRYLGRGIKGVAAIDWDDEVQRNALLTEEVKDADKVAAKVAELWARVSLPDEVGEALALLVQVARQDVEELDDGSFRIARGTAAGRIISVTDPEARHGRKSSSKVINGFKTHVMGTIERQFVTGIAITDAAVHDAAPTTVLIGQVEQRGLKPAEAVADGAYGTGSNLRACKELGVDLHTKQGRPSSRGAIPKRDFTVDLEQMTVTCPQGEVATEPTWVRAESGSDARVPAFSFPKAKCQACPLKDTCCSATAKGGKRTLRLSTHEAELQTNRAFSQTERGRDVLRSRSAVERLISHLVRMGMRNARFFTMKKVQLQAYLVAAAYNLQRVMTLTAATTG